MIAAARGAIPHFTGTVEEGLPALRRDWILKRGDVEEYDGREVTADGRRLSLRASIADFASATAEKNRLVEFPGLTTPSPQAAARQSRQGRHATRLRPRRHHHAGNGIHRHPRKHGNAECRIADLRICCGDIVRNDLNKQHAGSAQLSHSTFALAFTPAFSHVSRNASRTRSRRSSSAAKSPRAAPSSRPTSIIPNSSR